MAFFKFRTRGPQGNEGRNAPAAVPAESVETMRRRARHRLLGAAVLVLLGVIGFPLLFDTQPRPVSVDIPIEIPDRNKVKPLPVPAAPTAPAVSSAAPPAAAAPDSTAPAAAPSPAPAPATRLAQNNAAPSSNASNGGMITESADGTVIESSKPVTEPTKPKAEPKPEPKAEAKSKPEPKPEPKPESKPRPASDDGARARALLEGKPVSSAPAAAAKPAAADAGGRFVVQVGAFADADKAREVRQKLERAGLKTSVSVAKTADGERTRVRVGPFASRDEADRAAAKVKGLSLSAAILTL